MTGLEAVRVTGLSQRCETLQAQIALLQAELATANDRAANEEHERRNYEAAALFWRSCCRNGKGELAQRLLDARRWAAAWKRAAVLHRKLEATAKGELWAARQALEQAGWCYED